MRSIAHDEVVCPAGDPADSLHLVTTGRLAVPVSLASGDTAMISGVASCVVRCTTVRAASALSYRAVVTDGAGTVRVVRSSFRLRG